MSPVKLNAGSLFEHMRHICSRPRMFAPDFKANGGDLERTLEAIIRLLDEFLATEGAEFVRFPERETQYDIIIQKPERRPERSPRSKR